MRRFINRILPAVVLLLAPEHATGAQTPPQAPGPAIGCSAKTACEFQVFIENDSFGAGTDRYYTNGFKIGGGVGAEPVVNFLFHEPVKTVLRKISRHLDDVDPGAIQLGLFAGQNLYTPRRITVAAAQPLDRPWAAWLYIGGVAQSVRSDRLQTVELDLGMVGPAALGKPVQTEWHKLVGAEQPLGWGNQIRNEPGVLLAYLSKWRYGPATGLQVVPHAGATVGNVMTLARAGGIVRVGQNMSGFGPDTIEPGGALLQSSRLADGAHRRPEWYVFAGFDSRVVGRNIFLDGNSFRESASVDRRVFVTDLKAGFSVRLPPLRLSVTHVQRSPEFDTPLGNSGMQKFQSINVSWEF